MTLQFWFDFASTYSYPAAMRIEAIAQAHRVEIEWNAFLLGPIFKAQGWDDSPFNIYPAKGKYMWRDLERICDSLAIPFKKPSVFPRNSVLAARVAHRFADAAWLPAFVKAVFQANFAEDQDIAKRSVITACLLEAKVDADAIIVNAKGPDSRPAFRAQTQRAIDLGVFGAPTFVSNGEIFWGNDRLEEAIQWHVDHSQPPPTD